jgi:hypothetical protein
VKVANYGIGGQYDSHVDASDTQWRTSKEKLAEKEVKYHETFGDRVKKKNTTLEFLKLKISIF